MLEFLLASSTRSNLIYIFLKAILCYVMFLWSKQLWEIIFVFFNMRLFYFYYTTC